MNSFYWWALVIAITFCLCKAIIELDNAFKKKVLPKVSVNKFNVDELKYYSYLLKRRDSVTGTDKNKNEYLITTFEAKYSPEILEDVKQSIKELKL